MIWKIILGLLVAVAALIIWGSMAKNDPEWMEKERAKTAIELCREDQKKYVGDASSLAIIIPTCEKFEAEFKAKYGSNP